MDVSSIIIVVLLGPNRDLEVDSQFFLPRNNFLLGRSYYGVKHLFMEDYYMKKLN